MVRDRQRGHVARDLLADARQELHRRLEAADAVQADDIGAGLLEHRAGVRRSHAVAGHGFLVDAHGDDCGQAGRLDRLERHARFLGVGVGLGDDEVDARLGGPRDLLVEHRLDGLPGLGVVGVEDVRVADVAGEERAGLVGDLLRERERVSVQLLEEAFLADDAHLLAVCVVGERLDDVGARVHELAMELGHLLRVVEHGLGDECAGLDEPAPLELEEVALRADDVPLLEALEKSGSGHAPSLVRQRKRPPRRGPAPGRGRPAAGRPRP